MEKLNISQIRNTSNSKENIQILQFQDYVFEINNEDINKVKVSYYFDKIKNTIYKNGLRK